MHKGSIPQRRQSISDELLQAHLNCTNCAHRIGRLHISEICMHKVCGIYTERLGKGMQQTAKILRDLGSVQKCLHMIRIIIINPQIFRIDCLQIRLTNSSRGGGLMNAAYCFISGLHAPLVYIYIHIGVYIYIYTHKTV